MNLKILIVEDHETVRSSLRDWLGSAIPDCVIAEADSGEQAIQLSSEQPPDLVLMDIGLPGINGIEATRQIKAGSPSTLVVITTIYDDQIYQADAIDAGASAYIPKHKIQTELLPILESLIMILNSSRILPGNDPIVNDKE